MARKSVRGRDFRILLVYPNSYLMNMLPPAIALFSALLQREGYVVELFDTTYHADDVHINNDEAKTRHLQVRPFTLEGTKIKPKTTNVRDDMVKTVESFRPDLIAISVVEDTFPLGVRLLQAVGHYHIPVIMGGVFPTFAPDKAIAVNEVDIVCVGEGEHALLELCNRMSNGESYHDIPNLWVKDKSGSDGNSLLTPRITRNPLGPRVDIDDVPLPDFSPFEEARLYRPMAGKVYRMIPFETHRGCPYQCAFCNSPSQNVLYKQGSNVNYFRRRSMESIRREMDFLIKRWNPEYIYFTADTFLAWSDKEFDEFIETYQDYKLPFWCQTRGETITREKIGKLESVGLHRMSIGVEHGNEEFRRKIIKRNYSNDVIVNAFSITAEHGIPVTVNNIIAFPTETRDLVFDTIHLNRKISHAIDTVGCSIFTPFHGTPLRESCIEKGYIDDSVLGACVNQGSILAMPQFPKEEIMGMVRTFSLYVRFPESRWPEIEKAEHDTPEGNALFKELSKEFVDAWYTGESVS